MSRTSSFYRGCARAVAAAVMLFLMTACATPSAPPPLNLATPSHAAPGSNTPPSPRTVRLSCADAGFGNAPAGNGNLAIGGVTFEGLGGPVRGSRAADFGMNVPAGRTLYFFKTPVWLKAGAAATIELAPASDGYLAWVPAGVWTSGAGVDLTPWMAPKLVLDGCPDRDVTYLGGLLSTAPNICLTLHVTDASGESRQVSVGSACG